MSSLPFPVRVAAGVVVSAVEEAWDLPRTLAGLPITAVSRVLQLSMRAQQVVTELAIKGDAALDGARPVQDAPSWARFDEDVESGRRPPRGTSAFDAADDEAVFTDDPVLTDDSVLTGDSVFTDDDGIPSAPGRIAGRNGHAVRNGTPGDDGATASVTPDALPGYETMTIAQLRGRLRSLSLEQVTELLAWESAHADRPPFVTMLSNRITTLAAEQ